MTIYGEDRMKIERKGEGFKVRIERKLLQGVKVPLLLQVISF